MAIADRKSYLMSLVKELYKIWPENKTINIVCHGHSVPAGYTSSHYVDTFNAYPHLWHKALKERFPHAVINVIVSAVGGEDSFSGARRFEKDVLNHCPDLITIDYGLNDQRLSGDTVRRAWIEMITMALDNKVNVLLLTPSMDIAALKANKRCDVLEERTQIIRELAEEYSVGLVDSYKAFQNILGRGVELCNLLSWSNHPNRIGHGIITMELMKWFPLMDDK